MLAGFSLISEALVARKEPMNMLVCGTGAGILPMFLKNNFGPEQLKSLITVDVNAQMVDVAERFFGFDAGADSVIESVIADAYAFLPAQAEQSFDAVFIDVNFEEGL